MLIVYELTNNFSQYNIAFFYIAVSKQILFTREQNDRLLLIFFAYSNTNINQTSVWLLNWYVSVIFFCTENTLLRFIREGWERGGGYRY